MPLKITLKCSCCQAQAEIEFDSIKEMEALSPCNVYQPCIAEWISYFDTDPKFKEIYPSEEILCMKCYDKHRAAQKEKL